MTDKVNILCLKLSYDHSHILMSLFTHPYQLFRRRICNSVVIQTLVGLLTKKEYIWWPMKSRIYYGRTWFSALISPSGAYLISVKHKRIMNVIFPRSTKRRFHEIGISYVAETINHKHLFNEWQTVAITLAYNKAQFRSCYYSIWCHVPHTCIIVKLYCTSYQCESMIYKVPDTIIVWHTTKHGHLWILIPV